MRKIGRGGHQAIDTVSAAHFTPAQSEDFQEPNFESVIFTTLEEWNVVA